MPISKALRAKFNKLCIDASKMRDRLPECRNPTYYKRYIKRKVREDN